MKRSQKKRLNALAHKYPPSQPCACQTCVAYCSRPGWWTVEEAAQAVDAGYGGRMMLEMAPDRSYGVLSPAFKGCETAFASDLFSTKGCTFLKDNRCELFGTGRQPLECRYCHHERVGKGVACHDDIGKEWNTPAGRELVVRWSKATGFWERQVASRLQEVPAQLRDSSRG
jgi:hypothetical protein